jgi:ubiquinone/menaquinone biosynthesis C-methylase UbiE
MVDFVCPRTHQPLALDREGSAFVAPDGTRYPIRDGIPDFLVGARDEEPLSADQSYYRERADEYDRGNEVMFKMLLCEEGVTRDSMIDMLRIGPGARVLEIGCGTCRDTAHLLSRGTTVYAGDLAREMVLIGRDRLQRQGLDLSCLHLFQADAMHLPFPDRFFDAAFHFGGLNLFPQIDSALAEMSRVVRGGGRVVAGDEGIGPWLSHTEFAKILENSNPLFRHRAPLEKIPVAARDVTCRWVLNGSFYLLAFEVGPGEPGLDLDVEFPGWRGGSHRTRYFGKLEGVSPELRDRVVRKAASEGLSITAWLEKTLRSATGAS